MIEFNLGVPGSGKSYRGIYALYSNFGLNEKLKDSKYIYKDIEFAYTNINEIKLECFEKDKVLPLEWDKFYIALTSLHTSYKAKINDSELIVKARDLNLYKCLIILDECQNYLDINDKVLIWWLSYHRHLNQQIFLITQNLALVYSKYKSFSEFFYMAKPSSLKLFKNKMVYNMFTSSRLSQVSKGGTIKIPFVKDIFDSYHSGANQQSENLIKKFLLMAVFFFVAVLIILYLVKYNMVSEYQNSDIPLTDSKILEASVNNYQNYNNVITPIEKIDNNDDLKLYKFSCFKELCLYQFEDNTIIEVPQNILKSFLINIDLDKKYLKMQNNRQLIYVLIEESKLNFLNKGRKNENITENNAPLLSFPK
jgi:zona occludens toxin